MYQHLLNPTFSPTLISTLSSRNAYMLTYTRRRTPTHESQPLSPPSETMNLVSQDNTAFELDLKEHSERYVSLYHPSKRHSCDVFINNLPFPHHSQANLRQMFDFVREGCRTLYRSWDVNDDTVRLLVFEHWHYGTPAFFPYSGQYCF